MSTELSNLESSLDQASSASSGELELFSESSTFDLGSDSGSEGSSIPMQWRRNIFFCKRDEAKVYKVV